ncbi:hypothetical protein HK098_002695 [Nowakowskiella sp. JEL0407]|nr:hypothetical protein HK098_002695 [Nowakowskiella sp. JEL0407]
MGCVPSKPTVIPLNEVQNRGFPAQQQLPPQHQQFPPYQPVPPQVPPYYPPQPVPQIAPQPDYRPTAVRKQFPNAKVVVGVDFGTYVSHQPPRIASPKAPTVLNYSISPNETTATHWGWTVDSIPPAPQMKRIERCKLLLHDDFVTRVGTTTNINDMNSSRTLPNTTSAEIVGSNNVPEIGRNMILADLELPAGLQPVRVIADYLRFLNQTLKGQVEKLLREEGYYQPLTHDKFVYCFTVPVFWNSRKLQVMREAVFQAGMIASTEVQNLMFCSEPVAGLLSFIKSPHFNLRLPCTALILDAGGGTVDLFQCTILQTKDITEVTQADGGFFGASLVDRYFWQFIQAKLGPEAYNSLWNDPSFRTTKIDILQKWEGFKREFHENEAVWIDPVFGGHKQILLSHNLCAIIPPEYSHQLPANGTEIWIYKDDMKRFFDPAVNDIVKMVLKQLDSANATPTNKLDALFLLGGFCSSPYLRDKVTNNYSISSRVSKMPSIPQPEGAVVQGAAWYALDKSVIAMRKAPVTMGLRIARPYDVRKDNPAEVFNSSDPINNWRVYKGFMKFVRVGQSIPVGSSFPHKAHIHQGHQANIEILKSELIADPVDAQDPGVSTMGLFRLDISPWYRICPEWNGTTFNIAIEFGDLELRVKISPVLHEGLIVSQERMQSLTLSTTLTSMELY